MTDQNRIDGRGSRIEIVAQILEAVADYSENGDGVTKTTLMYEVFLNNNQLREYLAALTAYNLLRYDPATGKSNSTKKGLRYLELWYNINEMANELQPHQQQQMWMKRK